MGLLSAPSLGAATALTSAWLVAACIRFVALDDQYARARTEQAQVEFKSPGPEILAAATFQHRLAAADVTWMSVVQELGRATTLTDAMWNRIERVGHVATDLDPRYFTIYHAIAVNLSVFGRRVEASDEFLLRGQANLPDRWEFPFVLGYNAYFVRGQPILASDYIVEAARLPDSPPFLPALASRMRFHGGDEAGALEMIEAMAPGLAGRPLQEALDRAKVLRSEVRLRDYDRECAAYRKETGTMPTPAQLFELGRVSAPPEDYFGEPAEFDDDCITRTKMLRVREFEAQKRTGSFAPDAKATAPPDDTNPP